MPQMRPSDFGFKGQLVSVWLSQKHEVWCFQIVQGMKKLGVEKWALALLSEAKTILIWIARDKKMFECNSSRLLLKLYKQNFRTKFKRAFEVFLCQKKKKINPRKRNKTFVNFFSPVGRLISFSFSTMFLLLFHAYADLSNECLKAIFRPRKVLWEPP